jgi:hypothetical protein
MGIMMQAIKVIAFAAALIISMSSFADATCEQSAKTRDDFLACAKADTNKMLSESVKIYASLRKLAVGDKLIALEKNNSLWRERMESDCSVIAYSFNDWGDGYSPDTDFQLAACRAKIASQELDFYKWLACPEDMETSSVPKCAALHKALGGNR